MWVTESGMVKLAKELQPLQAPSAMWVTGIWDGQACQGAAKSKGIITDLGH